MFRLKYKILFLFMAPLFLLLLPGVNKISAADSAPRCYYENQMTSGSSENDGEKPCGSNQLDSNYNYKPNLCYIVGIRGPGLDIREVSCSDPRFGDKFEVDCKEENPSVQNCGIIRRIRDIINVLSALVGIIAVIMLTVWGIQYTASRDNPQMVASARLHILQTVLAVVMYLFVYAFLQWLIPGGLL